METRQSQLTLTIPPDGRTETHTITPTVEQATTTHSHTHTHTHSSQSTVSSGHLTSRDYSTSMHVVHQTNHSLSYQPQVVPPYFSLSMYIC